MTGRSRSISPKAVACAAAALATLVAFVQIERGTGSVALSLLYVAHDVMMCAALGLLLLPFTRRPCTSAAAGVGVVFLVWFASYLKVASTNIPALASDLPRIFDTWDVIVDFGWPALVAAAAFVAALVVLIRVERPLPVAWLHRLSAAAAAVVLLAGSAAIQARIPVDDDAILTDDGPKIAQFFRSVYTAPDFHDAHVPDLGPYCCFRNEVAPHVRFRGKVKPNIVVVLQESTFPPQDLRGVSAVSNKLLDGAAPLLVDVVGGGTWVEEYAMLHGVAPSVYGRDFLQVLWLGREKGLEGRIAPMLAENGYRTVSIFPYFGKQLGDSEAMQRSLGFEKVLDCGRIRGCKAGGAWTTATDADVYDQVIHELRSKAGPAFVYAATLRQHSPHVDKYPKTAYRNEILAEYLRRLDLSGKEAEAFLRELGSLQRPTLVLMFGDHIPGDVNAAYSRADFRTSRRHTFFNLFDASGEAVAAKVMARYPSVSATSVAYLDAVLLRQAGFEGDYIDRKLAMMQKCGGAFCVPVRRGVVATATAGR